MKCFPVSLSFVLPNTLSGRPWWKSTVTGHFIRADGQSAGSREEAERIDRKHPLPRPDFHTGQIWALDLYESLRIYTITGSLLSENNDVFYVTGPYLPPSISRGQLTEYLQQAFLLFDPIGQKAPWAPE